MKHRRRWGRIVLGTAFIVALATPARALNENAGTCPPPAQLVSLDEKVCPAPPGETPLVLKRACCENPGGRVHCKHFPHCPKRSPS